MFKLYIFLFFIFCFSVLSIEYEGDARKFILNNEFNCPSTQLKFKSPDLNTTKLRVGFQEVTPGITWQLIFLEETGYSAVVTYTKIRAEYPKNDLLLERIASQMKMECLRVRGYLEWCDFLSDQDGKVLQAIVRYPYAGNIVSIRNNWLNSMESIKTDIFEIKHYLIRDGYLLEFKVYIPQFAPPPMIDEDESIKPWLDNLKEFTLGCSLLKKGDPYATQVDEFKSPDTYFQFIFKDPSR
ncbi:MAG: hypothetical protein MK193_01300 [Lentisphaeria bacterium]|nr:hypothetical protein [Lentisphaeria bacterium]